MSSSRRGADPVREYPGQLRVAYWPSGRPGVLDEQGQGRIFERQPDLTTLKERAAELRSRFERRRGAGPSATATLAQAVRDWVDDLRDADNPEGTVNQYRYAFNAHVPERVMLTRTRDLGLADWEQIFDPARLTAGTLPGVDTALGSFIKWATTKGYFGEGVPWGGADQRRAIVSDAKRRIANRAAAQRASFVVVSSPNRVERAETARAEHDEIREGITPDVCPSPEDVERLASAMEKRWEGYGADWIWTVYGTGARFGESLAWVVPDIGRKVRIQRQLNQRRAWPATMPPKYRVERETGMSSKEWSTYLTEGTGLTLTPQQILDSVLEKLLGYYRQRLPLLPGAVDVVRRMSHQWPVGLASSSNREVIDGVLRLTRLTDAFAATVSSEEVPRGKPAPDVYLEAACRLNVLSFRCAAVEDSANGIRSAASASMLVLAIPNPHYLPSPDVISLADLVLSGLDELTVETVTAAHRNRELHVESRLDEQEIEPFPASDPHADWAGPS